MKQFEIKLLNLNWLNKSDKFKNESAYGKVYLKIGEEIVCDENKGEWTLSTTVLYLMRTVNKNYEIGDFGSQLIPCCGHITDLGEHGIIMGCPNGIDWTIRHNENNQIEHISENGSTGLIDKKTYRKLVVSLANQVEKFYEENRTSENLKNPIIQNGYKEFWREWKKLKTELEIEN